MLKVNNNQRFVLLLLSAVVLSACDRGKDLSGQQQDKSTFIAHVNETPISQQQLEFMKSRLFAQKQPATNMDKIILESLVASRAMSLAALENMSAEEKARLDIQVMAYREELLMKHYLSNNVTPQAVTSEMVKEYYESHPEEFSGGIVKTFEFITTVKKPTAEQRKEILTLFKNAAEQKYWDKLSENNSSLLLKYKKATSNIAVLEEPLKRLVTNTKAGNVSPVHIVDNIMIVRVNSEKLLEPKPLSQVSAQIRKKLAPIKLRDAIKKAKEEVLAKTKVEYPAK